MEQQNFLQRPGGLGPMPALKPLGMPMANPSAYMNDEISISSRRQAYLDDVNRVFAQYNIDHGEYARTPVPPATYGEGNITPSAQVTGPAGYQHRGMPLPERAVDMPEAQYLSQETNKFDPSMRLNVQALTLLPEQNFYNVKTQESLPLPQDYRRLDDLSLQEQAFRGAPNGKK